MNINGSKALWAFIGTVCLAALGAAGGYFVAQIKAGEKLIDHERRLEVIEKEALRIADLASKRGEYIDKHVAEHDRLLRLLEKLDDKVSRIERIQIERTPFIPKKPVALKEPSEAAANP